MRCGQQLDQHDLLATLQLLDLRAWNKQQQMHLQVLRKYSSNKFSILNLEITAFAAFTAFQRLVILAQAMKVVIGRGTKSRIYLSESEIITIAPPGWRSYFGAEYPHIAAYDRVLIYPNSITKDELIENAKRIAATWCPMACVIWSATETIWARDVEEVVININRFTTQV